MKPINQWLPSSPFARWVLFSLALLALLQNPLVVSTALASSSSDAQNNLNFNTAYSAAQGAGGVGVMQDVFNYFFWGCLLTMFVLAAIAIITFARTHEWAKIQNIAIACGMFFALTGVFFWLMGHEGSTSAAGSTAFGS